MPHPIFPSKKYVIAVTFHPHFYVLSAVSFPMYSSLPAVPHILKQENILSSLFFVLLYFILSAAIISGHSSLPAALGVGE